jgi:hypothetical protein
MDFRVVGLPAGPFTPLYGLPADDLAARGIVRVTADATPGFPDRVEMRDAVPGETLLLLNHVHHEVDNPYRASHAIYVREGATRPFDAVNAVPECLARRLLSVRAFDAQGMMVDADVVDGHAVKATIERLFSDPRVALLHAHYAKRGCFAARVLRA